MSTFGPVVPLHTAIAVPLAVSATSTWWTNRTLSVVLSSTACDQLSPAGRQEERTTDRPSSWAYHTATASPLALMATCGPSAWRSAAVSESGAPNGAMVAAPATLTPIDIAMTSAATAPLLAVRTTLRAYTASLSQYQYYVKGHMTPTRCGARSPAPRTRCAARCAASRILLRSLGLRSTAETACPSCLKQ